MSPEPGNSELEAVRLCACGCGSPVSQGSRFRRGHNRRVALSKSVPEYPTSTQVINPGEEFGVHGTPIFAGIIYDDFNSKFADPRTGLKIYDEMRRTDGTVQAVLLAMELPLLQADWYIQAASSDPVDVYIAEAISWNLFEGMSVSWKDFLRQSLGMHWAGFSVFEKVFEVKQFRGQEFIGYKKLAQRLQSTVYKWDFDAHGGPQIMYQLPPLGGNMIPIPIWKLLVFTNRREGGNVQGMSNLRGVYKHWYMKDRLYRLQAISLERDSVGVPVIKLPPKANAKDKAIAEEVVTNLRKDEDAGVVLPQGWILELLKGPGSGQTASGFMEAIQHHDVMIAKGALAQFLNLGESGRGAYALAVPFQDLLTMAEEAQADAVADTVTAYGIRQLVNMNWPGRPVPQLKHGDIRKKDLRIMSLILSALTSAGLVDPDPAFLAWVRHFFGFPERGELTAAPGAEVGVPQSTSETPAPGALQADALRGEYPELARFGELGRDPKLADLEARLAREDTEALRAIQQAEAILADSRRRGEVARDLAASPAYRALLGVSEREEVGWLPTTIRG